MNCCNALLTLKNDLLSLHSSEEEASSPSWSPRELSLLSLLRSSITLSSLYVADHSFVCYKQFIPECYAMRYQRPQLLW